MLRIVLVFKINSLSIEVDSLQKFFVLSGEEVDRSVESCDRAVDGEGEIPANLILVAVSSVLEVETLSLDQPNLEELVGNLFDLADFHLHNLIIKAFKG